MKKFLCAAAVLVMLTAGCTQSTEQITETSFSETTAEITTTKVTTETTTETSAETVTESTESVTETDNYEEYSKDMEYFFSYDLDGDGTDDDLFIDTSREKDNIFASIYNDKFVNFQRMDSIYLYNAIDYNEHDTRFLIHLENEYGCISNMYWGLGNVIWGNGYGMDFHPDWCSWHWFNSSATKEEFETAFADKTMLFEHNYIKKSLELYETINIKEKLAEKFGYSEKYIGRIEKVGLDVFELENDPFDKKYKFQSGELCCYTFGGENIKIYSRPREIWVGFKLDGHNEENGETEYLISVSSGDGDSGTMEFIYTGIESEKYTALYDRCVYASDSSLDRFRQNEELYKKAANNTDEYLSENRWKFVGEAEINTDGAENSRIVGSEWENEYPELIPLRDFLIKLEEENKLYLCFPNLFIRLFDYNNDGIKDALITAPFIAGQPTYLIIDNIDAPQLVDTFGAFDEADLMFDPETEQIVIKYNNSYVHMTNATSETNFIFLCEDIDEVKHVAFTGTARPEEYYIEHLDEKRIMTKTELNNSIAEMESGLSSFSDFEKYKMTFGDDGIFISRLDT